MQSNGTNMPSIGPVALNIAFDLLKKENLHGYCCFVSKALGLPLLSLQTISRVSFMSHHVISNLSNYRQNYFRSIQSLFDAFLIDMNRCIATVLTYDYAF